MNTGVMLAADLFSRPVHVLSILAVSISLSIVILALARRGQLSMRYTLGWIFVAICISIGGLFSGLVKPIADALGVGSAVLVVGVAASGLLAITVQLSISVSGLIEANRTLAESIAILRERLDTEEFDGNDGACAE